ILVGLLPLWNHPAPCLISVGKGPRKKALHLAGLFTKVTSTHFPLSRSMTLQPVFWFLSLFWKNRNVPGFSAKLLKGSGLTGFLQAPTWHQMLNRQNTMCCFVLG